MNQYFNAVKRIDVLDKGYVELWSGWNSNINEDSRIETVTTIASLSYGNEAAKNPKALYERLQKEGHESVMEFIRDGDVFWYGIESSLRHKPELVNYSDFYEHDEETINACKYDHRTNLITLKIKMPIFVARQIMRHRVSMLEMSRRYVKDSKVPFEFYNDKDGLDDVYNICVRAYESMLKDGVKPETARCVLPLATYTTVFMMFDKNQLENFLKLRLDSHTQEQTREYAQAIKELWDYQQGIEI